MSNGVNAPFGFTPTGHISCSTYNGKTATFFIQNAYAGNIFTNAPVLLTRLGVGTPAEGLYVAPHPGTAVAGPVLGMVSGIYYLTPQGLSSPGQLYWPSGTVLPANTVALAKVIIDPNVTYNVQSGNPAPAGTTNAQCVNYTSIGQNYQFQFGTPTQGNLSTGQSNAMLNIPNAAAGGDATYPFKCIGLAQTSGNQFGVPYNNALVTINNSYFRTGTPSQA